MTGTATAGGGSVTQSHAGWGDPHPGALSGALGSSPARAGSLSSTTFARAESERAAFLPWTAMALLRRRGGHHRRGDESRTAAFGRRRRKMGESQRCLIPPCLARYHHFCCGRAGAWRTAAVDAVDAAAPRRIVGSVVLARLRRLFSKARPAGQLCFPGSAEDYLTVH